MFILKGDLTPCTSRGATKRGWEGGWEVMIHDFEESIVCTIIFLLLLENLRCVRPE